MKRFFLTLVLLIALCGPAFAGFAGDFTAVNQVSTAASFEPGETVTFTLTGAFTGTVVLERSKFLDAGFTTVTSTTGTTAVTAVNDSGQKYYYRLRCTAIGEAETISYVIGEASGQIVQFFEDSDGVARLNILDGGVGVVGTLDVTGAATMVGTAFSGGVTVGTSGTGYNVTLYGDTAGKYLQWTQASDKLTLVGDIEVNTNKFTVAHTTGNTLIAGSLAANGGITVDTSAFTVADTSGNTSIAGTLDVTGEQTTGAGVGAATGSGVTAVEYGNGTVHKTVITLTAASFGVLDEAEAGQYGGIKLYDLPAGNVVFLGATIDADITLVGEEWLDNAEGDVGLGTTVVTNADALATTEQNIIPTTAVAALVAQVGPINASSADTATVNAAGGTDTDIILNVRVDDNAAHIAATATVTGTVTIVWASTGDF